MHVYLSIYLYIRSHFSIYACLFTRRHTFIYIERDFISESMYVCMYVCIRRSLYLNTLIFLNVCKSVDIYLSIYLSIHLILFIYLSIYLHK